MAIDFPLVIDENKKIFTEYFQIATLRKNQFTDFKNHNYGGLWQEVKNLFLDKKKVYLRNGDHHLSFVVHIETINEIHNKFLCNKPVTFAFIT